ncbi:unnamed protein product [Caretta caretta]
MELVDDLYYFRDHYFESHGVEDAERKQQDVLEETEKTLQQMGEIDVCSQGLAQVLMLKGKVLNITPDYSPQVEELLAKAVKLDPEVWKNKVLLKNLSMVLQQLQAESAEQHAQNVMDSIQQAKLAVQMDMQDSHLWLHKYEENYTEALEGFSHAAALDPAWPEPRQCQQQLLDFLEHLTSLLEIKGKVKGKKWQSMLGSLHPSQLGPCEDGQYQGSLGQKAALEHRPLIALQLGVNTGAIVLGRVVFSLTTDKKVPFTFSLADSEGPCFAITVYNMLQSWGVLISNLVAIPKLHLQQHHVQHQGNMSTARSLIAG